MTNTKIQSRSRLSIVKLLVMGALSAPPSVLVVTLLEFARMAILTNQRAAQNPQY